MKPHIVILSSSVRTDRKSHRVALFFKSFLDSLDNSTSEIVDLTTCNFPIFHERLRFTKDAPPDVLEFSGKIKNASGVIIVTPEYNGGYPASLKNVVDLLYDEWYKKPVAISTVSDGIFGGSQVITSLQFSLWKIRAWTVPAMFPVPKINESFDENGVPADKPGVEKRAKGFIDELFWCIEAVSRMKS